MTRTKEPTRAVFMAACAFAASLALAATAVPVRADDLPEGEPVVSEDLSSEDEAESGAFIGELVPVEETTTDSPDGVDASVAEASEERADPSGAQPLSTHAVMRGTVSGLPSLKKGQYYEVAALRSDPSDADSVIYEDWAKVGSDGSYDIEVWSPADGTTHLIALYRWEEGKSGLLLQFLKDTSGNQTFSLKAGSVMQRNLVYAVANSTINGGIRAQSGLSINRSWPVVEIYQSIAGHWFQIRGFYTQGLDMGSFGGYEAPNLAPGTYAVRCMTVARGAEPPHYVQPSNIIRQYWWKNGASSASATKITVGSKQTKSVSCDMNHSVYVSSPKVKRLAGANRFATSVAVSKANYSPGVPVAFVAYGMGFPDALSGAPAASKLGGPVLLTQAKSLPSDVRAELVRLKPKKIVVLGGKGVVSDSVLSQLRGLTTGGVERWSGSDRYGTAVAVSREAFDPGVPVAFIAYGRDFPDALSGAPAAAKNKGPILLVEKNSIPASVKAELQRLQPGKIVVLGGKGVVSESVRNELAKLSQGGAKRWSGTDRFATSASISSQTFAPGVDRVYIANGAGFPDALTGGPVAGKNGSPILLVRKERIPDATQTELERLRPKEIVIIGGTGVVNRDVEMRLADYTVR